MPGLPRLRRLSTKFLLLAVPAIVLASLVFVAILGLLQSRELQRLNRTLAEQQLERGVDLLRYPVWNVDPPTTRSILEQLVAAERIRCVRLYGAVGIVEHTTAGDCGELGEPLERIERPIDYSDGSGVQQIGMLEYLVDTSVDRERLLQSLLPLAYLSLLMVAVLTGCVLLAFRWTILTPLERVARSIRDYRHRGERAAVDWDSADELGEFIREYNDGLQRQELAERGLQEQLNFQMALRNTLPTPFAYVDREWQVFDANPAFHQLFGIDPGARLPPLSALLPGVDWGAIHRLPAGGVHGEELTPPAGPLAGRTFLLGASPWLGPDGAVRGHVLVLQDISKRIADEHALREAMADTERALHDLRQAQRSLVQAEKLASLGSLVAGIAHEINTPVGNSITVATALSERVEALQQAFERGDLKRSTMIEFLRESDEACRILHRALRAAAEQIQKFKQVAVDQTSSQRRRFDLAETVDEVLSTLRPQLRRTRHTLELAIPPGIELDSFPGPLGQVIVNCFTNALMHGFDGVESGTLRISAEPLGDRRVIVTVADSGRGIPGEHLGRIFDPFFTTKMGQGGSGLGMNLVYTIVTGLLGGRIDVRSAPGAGTRVIIDIPLCAPTDAPTPEAVHVT